MKRYGNLWESVISFEALLRAAEQACKGKRFCPDVAAFHFNLEHELWALHEELATKTYTANQARLAVREAEDRAVLDVNVRFRKMTEMRAQLNVAKIAQESAREKLRVKTNQYQIQAALLSDVLHLRADRADADDRYQQALSAFWTAKADFEQATGEDVIQ